MGVFNKKIKMFLFLACYFISFEARSADLKFITIDVVSWAHYDEVNKKYVGIFPDLVREIERRTGHNISITLTPYVRVNRELEIARQDCTILIIEKERSNISVRGELVFEMPMGVIPTKKIKLNEYNDLYGISISVLRALSITEQFERDSDLNKEFDTDYRMGLRKMLHGRLDAIAGAIPTIKSLAREGGMKDMLGKPLQLGSEPIYLQCSKRSKNIIYMNDLNLAIQSIKKESILDDIISQHYW